MGRGASARWRSRPGAFPVLEADPPRRIVIEWAGEATTGDRGSTTTTFEFEPIDDARTLLTITESSWQATPDGAEHAFGNCAGRTALLAAMKAWIEHGINLRGCFSAEHRARAELRAACEFRADANVPARASVSLRYIAS